MLESIKAADTSLTEVTKSSSLENNRQKKKKSIGNQRVESQRRERRGKKTKTDKKT